MEPVKPSPLGTLLPQGPHEWHVSTAITPILEKTLPFSDKDGTMGNTHLIIHPYFRT